MRFSFNMTKTLAAAGFLCSLNGGKSEILKLLKMMYLADRTAFQRWHRPITGDLFVSMPKGPILSTTYDLIKGTAASSKQRIWSQFFSERQGNTVSLVRMPDVSYLSEREQKLLRAVFDKIHDIPAGQLIRWLHRVLPEWEDPNGSSKLIDPRKVLKYSMLTSEEIDEVDEELAHLRHVSSVLTVVNG